MPLSRVPPERLRTPQAMMIQLMRTPRRTGCKTRLFPLRPIRSCGRSRSGDSEAGAAAVLTGFLSTGLKHGKDTARTHVLDILRTRCNSMLGLNKGKAVRHGDRLHPRVMQSERDPSPDSCSECGAVGVAKG